MGPHRLVEMVTNRVSQGANGIIEDEQVLMQVLAKGKDKSVQDIAEVGHQLCASLLLQGGKGTRRRERAQWHLQVGTGPEADRVPGISQYEYVRNQRISEVMSVITSQMAARGARGKDCGVRGHLQAASCTLLLPSRMRLSSSVIRGLRCMSGGWLTTQWA